MRDGQQRAQRFFGRIVEDLLQGRKGNGAQLD